MRTQLYLATKNRYLYIFYLLILTTASSIAQDGRLIGLVNATLVEVDPFNVSLRTITPMDFPPGQLGSDMTYSTVTCEFYTTFDAANNPRLVKFDFEGNSEVVGRYTMPGETIFLLEALAFNPADGLVYGSASLDGRDFTSEHLVIVDTETAICRKVTRLSFTHGSSNGADIDNMVIANEKVYFTDGQPGDNVSDFLVLDLQNIQPTTSLTYFHRWYSYLGTSDLTFFQGDLYAPKLDLGLIRLNVTNLAETNLGNTHRTEYNGVRIIGLELIQDYVAFDHDQSLPDEIILCDEDTLLQINAAGYSIYWNTGDTTENLSVIDSGFYRVEVRLDECVIFTDSVAVSQSTDSFTEKVLTICNGPVVEDGITFDTEGVYEFMFENVYGCDSLVSYTVNTASSTEEVTYTLCEGETLLYENESITESGRYPFEFKTQGNCDSLILLDAVFHESYTFYEEYVVCSGDSIMIHGQNYDSAGAYEQRYTTIRGCDSIYNIEILVAQESTEVLNYNLCQGEALSYENQVITESGMYPFVFKTLENCDSLVLINAVFHENYAFYEEHTVCSGDSIIVQGQNYNTAGTYERRYTTTMGCDSIYNIAILMSNGMTEEVNYNLCQGETLNYENQQITESGTYPFEYMTMDNCDSLVLVKAFFQDTFEYYEEYALCPGDTLIAQGQNFHKSGTFEVNYPTVNGCDSIYNISIVNLEVTSSDVALELCPEDKVLELNGASYESPGEYVQNLTNVAGCDSTLNIQITEVQRPIRYSEAFLCIGATLEFGDLIIAEPGSYDALVKHEEGCDSLVYIEVTSSDVYIPNVIYTKDPSNNEFRPYTNCVIEGYLLRIYDRWGELVFISENPDVAWKGQKDDKELEQGVYTYMMYLGLNTPGEKIRAGSVTLLK